MTANIETRLPAQPEPASFKPYLWRRRDTTAIILGYLNRSVNQLRGICVRKDDDYDVGESGDFPACDFEVIREGGRVILEIEELK